MLTRAARRKLRQDAFRSSMPATFEQLRLPWLCPAVYGRRATATATPSKYDESHPRKRRKSSGQGPPPSRHQSTVAQLDPHDHHQFTPWSFQNSLRSSWPPDAPQEGSTGLSYLQPFDPSHTIQIDHSTQSPNRVARLVNGIGGSLPDMLQYMEVCARAGYLERAEKLLRRIEDIYDPGSEEVMMGENVLLKEMVRNAIQTSDASSYRLAQRNFETRIVAQGSDMDASTLATMINGCLLLLTGKQQERTIRRYLEYADSRKLEVFDRDYYDDSQFALLQEISNSGFQSPNFPNSSEIEESIRREEDVQGSELGRNRTYAPDGFMPEVRSVQLKGLGLKTLKKSLEAISTDNVSDDDLAKTIREMSEGEDLANNAEARQIMIERGAITAALERWRVENDTMNKMGISPTLHTKAMASLMWEWHTKLVPALKEELENIRESLTRSASSHGDERLQYGPFMQSVDPEKLSALTIIHVLNMLGIQGAAGGLRLAGTTKALGTQVEIESDMQALGGARTMDQLQKLPGKHRAKIQMRLNTARFQPKGHRAGRSIMQRSGTTANAITGEASTPELKWSAAIRVKIGAVLISKLMDTAKISVTKQHPKTGEMLTQLQPAFYHAYHYQQGKKIGRIAANFALVEKLSSEPPSGLLAKRLPMIVEPRPWKGYSDGGYYLEPLPVVRQKSSDNIQRSYTIAACEKGDMDQVFAGLSILGKTAWRINQDVLKVQLQAWDTGEPIADFAPENPTVVYPPEPPKDANRFALLDHRKVKENIENEKNGFHSQRCFQNFQLEIARTYRDETIYFPHNIDFRGRAYPIPPYLNHMGADNTRGLLMFAEGKELGDSGLRWLKIHLANVYGYDKASLKEREDFAMEHLPQIRDSVTHPLDGKRWWLKGEDPWLTLAACFELTRALDSPEPAKFVSHLPIHQDGTCNGLQHYAALGGDKLGATQVNLEPGDRPADIYSAVAEMVKQRCSQDVVDGHQYAKIVHGKITRKVVKQTVMTNVYGVTFVGAREQVQRQLDVLLPDLKNTGQIRMCASYLAINIFKALSTMFEGAHGIQHWFGQCADRISTSITAEQIKRFREHRKKSKDSGKLSQREKKQVAKSEMNILGFKSSVVWTTPLRMPVVQPYRTSKAKVVPTTLQSISIVEPQSWDPVSRRKQMAGFPPNFVHSLDATHMLLSALKCDEMGLTFASVHDSFWTHASEVPAMNRILRDAFVRMHSENIVGRLAAEFEARYKGAWYLAGVYARSRVGKKILQWRKSTFGTAGKASNSAETRAQELLMEQDRLRALKNGDEAARKQAEETVTPTTIFAAEEGDKEAFLVKPDTAKLGNVSETDNRAQIGSLDDTGDERQARSSQEFNPPPAPEMSEAIPNALESDGFGQNNSSELLTTLNKRKKAKPVEQKCYVWLPLTFPKVPNKGDFDVSRLKESQYFFS